MKADDIASEFRAIARGRPVRCVSDETVDEWWSDPVFVSGPLAFCVFFDAGDFDYVAWAALGQEVWGFDQIMPKGRYAWDWSWADQKLVAEACRAAIRARPPAALA